MSTEAADYRSYHSRERSFDARRWRAQQLGKAVPFCGSELFQLGCPPLASFIAAFLGCLMTLHLSASGLSPVIASAATAMLLSASLILTRTADLVPSAFFSSAYGGSFAGMTPVALLGASVARAGLPLDAAFTLLSLFSGLVFCLACALDLWFRGGLARGYGGRLGALAAVTSFLFITLAPLFGADRALFPIARMGVVEHGFVPAALTFALCTAGMLVTLMALRWPRIAASRRSVRIFVAATVALLGLMLLRQAAPDEACYLDAYYAGCFLGMSSPARLRGPLQSISAAALLAALLALSYPILPAVGGGLGYIAFVTVLFVEAAGRLFAEAGESPRQTMIAWTRGMAAAIAMASVLLASELLRERPAGEPTGSVVELAPAGAISATAPVAPSDGGGEQASTGAPGELTSAAASVPNSSIPDPASEPAETSDTLRPNDHRSSPQRLQAEPALPRVTRPVAPHAVSVKRSQIHVVPRPRAMPRHEVQLQPQEWRPDPSALGAP